MMDKKRYVLRFPPHSGDKPLSYHLVRDYDIRINILKAEVIPGKRGNLLLELEGLPENLKKGIEYLESHQVECSPLDRKVRFNQELCINCGNCTGVCFPGALKMDKANWQMKFDISKCVMCELCVKACPMRLFEIEFNKGF